MKTAKELYSELRMNLMKLDVERERTIMRIIAINLVYAFVFLFQFQSINQKFLKLFGFESGFSLGNWGGFILFVTIMGIVILYFVNKALIGTYAESFKTKIIPEIVKCFVQESEYNPNQYIASIEELMKSGFAKTTPKGMEGEDLVTGKIENVEVFFSEIDAYEVLNFKGPKKLTTLAGGFFLASLPTNVIEKLDIKGKFPFEKLGSFLFHKVFGFITGGFFIILFHLFLAIFMLLFYLFRWHELNYILLSVYAMYILYNIFIYYLYVPNGFKKVEVGNPFLEKKFSIYSTDTVEAKKIFTPELQKALIFLQEKTITATSVHIRKEKVYIFIPSGVNLFEPKLFSEINSLEVVQEIYDLWQGLHYVIAALNSGNQKYHSILLQ